MLYNIVNPSFPDISRIEYGDEVIIRSGSSVLNDSDFIETDFKYFPDKFGFSDKIILDLLCPTDKEDLGYDVRVVEKTGLTLFPTLCSGNGEEGIRYFSSYTSVSGDKEIICIIIPEDIIEVKMFDNKGVEAIRVSFEGTEIGFSKFLYVVVSYKEVNPMILNLSYLSYELDRNSNRKMSNYVLRNDSLVSQYSGVYEDNGFIYSCLSGSLMGTEKLETRPLYNLISSLSSHEWNRSKRYSIGDSAWIGDKEYESVVPDNIGNHPYYSWKWAIKNR